LDTDLARLTTRFTMLGMAEDRELRKRVAETLVAMGAPLAGWMPRAQLPREEALAAALQLALEDATVLRVLPVALAKNWTQVDWAQLERAARDRQLLQLLGMLVELTGELTHQPELTRKAGAWWKPNSAPRFLPSPRNRFDRELAEHGTPAVARKWGFLVNMGEDSFRSLLERHLG